MLIQSQCCTLEQAKTLKELGIAQESLHFHYQDKTPTNPNMHEYGLPQENMQWRISLTGKESRISTSNVHEEYSAFTVAELGVMLPEQIPTNSNIRFAELVSRKDCLQWTLGYDADASTMGGYGADVKSIYRGIISDNINEAQCRAAMLIYLLENNLVTAADCNTRLNSN